MKRLHLIILAALFAFPPSLAAQSFGHITPLSPRKGAGGEAFTFWYWMYGAVSKAGIKADLQGMKDIGLGGCYLMPIRGTSDRPEYGGTANQLSPAFWDMVDYAFQQADSLGLDMGIHVCDGFALAGGPWITPEESMQKVVWADTVVSAAALKGLRLARPEAYRGYYEDIACYAIPLKKQGVGSGAVADPIPIAKETLSGGMTRDDKGAYRATKPGSILFDFGRVQLVRNLEIIPSGNNIQCQRMKVMASNDGVNFYLLKQLQPARQGWQTVGYSFTEAVKPALARYIRLDWTPEGTEPGAEDLDAAKWRPVMKMAGVRFGAVPKIGQWRGKAGFTWLVGPETTAEELPPTDCVAPEDIYRVILNGDKVTSLIPNIAARISHNVSLHGNKITPLPPTTHHLPPNIPLLIRRIGHTSTGQMNATAGDGKGLEVDKFSQAAVQKLFDNWYGKFLARPHSSVVKYLHVDSWECGAQNWGAHFAEEFKVRRGYALLPWLPVMTGMPVASAQRSEQVLRDVRLTVNDLVNEKFFKTLEQLAHSHGKLVSHESIAPTFVADGLEHYKYSDLPMGEFWLRSPTHDKPNDMLDAISGAHIYGKRIVQAEGFTEIRSVWDETPALLKPLLDRHFALGMNRLFFHVDAHNPWMNRQPGMTLDGIGLFFQRDNTWYREAKGLVDYANRCQRQLQRGVPVVDVAVFTGEEMPSRALTPDRLVPVLPGLFGRERVESEAGRLANVGQPMEESPVGVHHSAGIVDLKDWINPLRGYQYDSMNKDALLHSSRVENGRIVMPGGNSYRVLVVPGPTKMNPSLDTLSAEMRNKLEALRKAGVAVIEEAWQGADLASLGIERDVELPVGVAYAHRSVPGEEDIYFLSNQRAEPVSFTAGMRVSGSTGCVLYDAVADSYSPPVGLVEKDGRTEMQISLPAQGSVFVIFSRGDTERGVPLTLPLTGRVKAIAGMWNLEFEKNETRMRTELPNDWTQYGDDAVRYYSGRAFYTNSFRWPNKSAGRVMLSVGEVRDIARVYVNGTDCGIAWTAPYEVDITRALKRGKNTVCIEVVNTWANALRGADCGKPPFEGIWTNAKYRMKGDRLLPAGLMGPVELRY